MQIDLDHLSHSSVFLYMTCPRLWHFRYAKGVKKPNKNMQLGSAVHHALQSYIVNPGQSILEHYENWVLGRTESTRILDSSGVQALISEESSYNQVNALMAKRNLRVADKWGDTIMLNSDDRAYVEKINDNPDLNDWASSMRSGPVVIERPVDFNVPDVPIPVIGYVDVTTEGNQMWDIKTSKSAWNQDKADNEMQAAFYTAALLQRGEIKLPYTFKYLVIGKQKSPKIQVMETVVDAERVYQAYRATSDAYKGIVSNYFGINPTTWKCSPAQCEAWLLCKGGRLA